MRGKGKRNGRRRAMAEMKTYSGGCHCGRVRYETVQTMLGRG